jgi:hypothetical protein
MSKTDFFEASLLQHLFQNLSIPNIGDAAGLLPSAASGGFYIALMITTPAPSDSSAGTETTYTGYARVAVNRTTAAWTISNNQVTNAAPITFPPCTGNPQTVGYFAIYTSPTGGDRIYYGSLNTQLIIQIGVTPEFSTSALIIIED